MSSSTSSRISSVSSPRAAAITDSPEFAELWKRSEYIRFSEHLRSLEEHQKFSLKKELVSVRKIETKLKQKLTELENKERDLNSAEINNKKFKEEIMAKIKRQQDDHFAQIKILNDQHAAELKIEREKSRMEEIKRKSTEVELGKLRNNIPHVNNSADQQLRLVQSELEQALEREKILIQSREYFRTTVIKLATARPELVGISSPPNPLFAKRTQLIESGMYDDSDPIIKEIDLKLNHST